VKTPRRPALSIPTGTPTGTQLQALAAQRVQSGGFQPNPQMDPSTGLPAIPSPPLAPAAPEPAPPPPAPKTHDVTIVTTKKLASAKVMGVPPEEFGIERGARDIENCNYCFHDVVTKTEGQLIAEGYDETQIKELTPYTGNTTVETLARDSVQEHLNVQGGTNTAARLVRITEHYVRMDYEGNGRPCLYQVTTGGDQSEVLEKDGKPCVIRFDQMPFASGTPVPITHRFFGRSIADLIMPSQREKTAIKRGGLDNIYLATNPRVEVAEQNAGPNTLDDLLVSRPGGVIRTKTPGGLNWQVVPNITAGLFPMMQYLDAEIESRTGVGKQTQGIDANALQNQSATAVVQVFSASQMRMKLFARILAETGVRRIFSLLHATIRKHGQQQQTVQLRKKWVTVDPRGWKARNDMTINVGLGTGGKAAQFAQTMAIGNVQKEMVAAGKTNLVGDTQLYHTATELTKIMGHKNPDRFFKDPDEKGPDGQLVNPPPAPQADPKLAVEQAKAQTAQAAAAQKAQLDAQQAQFDAIHQQNKAAAEKELAAFKAEVDAKLKLIDAHVQLTLAAQKGKHAQQAHDAGQERAGQAHHADMAGAVVDMVATAHAHDMAQERAAAAPKGDK
jgi:hypothetical protein